MVDGRMINTLWPINVVALSQAWLVPGGVTVFGLINNLGT